MSDPSVRPANCAACAFWRKLREHEGLCARHAPEPSIRPDEAAHFPQTHNWQWCGEGVAAEPMSIGSRCADCLYWRRPEGDSTPSTVATCRWPGGLRRGSAPAMRRARFPSRDRGRSGARRKARTFAPRACGGAPPNIRRRDDRLAFQARKTPRKPPSRTRLANALLLKFEFATFSGPPRPIYLERHDTMAVGRFDCPAIRRRE
jgi:hypothetical protein